MCVTGASDRKTSLRHKQEPTSERSKRCQGRRWEDARQGSLCKGPVAKKPHERGAGGGNKGRAGLGTLPAGHARCNGKQSTS